MDLQTSEMSSPLRILVLTRSYPAVDDLYQYPFVHRRVLAYRAAGHEVGVFRPNSGPTERHEFEGVSCYSGDPDAFRSFADELRPDVIAAHGLSETMWSSLKETMGVPVRAWLHGSEIPGIFRVRAEGIRDAATRDAALDAADARSAFWRNLLKTASAPRLVFVSQSAAELMREDVGEVLHRSSYDLIPNPIDTDLFSYAPRHPEQRFSILSIRPYECPSRGNDLAVTAVKLLAERSGFERLQFTFIGEGPLFEETLAPIANFQNVTLRRGFATQQQIASEHSRHGIFLVPTRLDTQGVSRDEAMASGLVPVTNSIPVIREFVDDNCAGLAQPNDALGLADEIWRMTADANLFLRRSAAAAKKIHLERSNERIIPAELSLLARAAHGHAQA